MHMEEFKCIVHSYVIITHNHHKETIVIPCIYRIQDNVGECSYLDYLGEKTLTKGHFHVSASYYNMPRSAIAARNERR